MSAPETRHHETVIEIPAPVEEVWKAITEASEVQRWFAPEVRTDPREGGEYFASWGPGMDGAGVIEVFDTPHHLRVVSSRVDPPVRIAQDFYLEGKGGVTVLRLVHSGFLSTADWDQEYNGTKAGWPVFFRVLRHALTRHRGAVARNTDLYALSSEPIGRVWELLAPLRPSALEGEKPPLVVWWIWPEQNDALVHLACSPYGAQTGVWLHVATFGLSPEAAAAIRTGWDQRLKAIFPEQTSGTCA
jgi:uncharacterized protein YndB with AHSA1/START domain